MAQPASRGPGWSCTRQKATGRPPHWWGVIAQLEALCRAQRQADKQQRALVLSQGQRALLPTAAGGHKDYLPSAAIAKRLPSKWPRPIWRPPWRNYRVLSGHLGCAAPVARHHARAAAASSGWLSLLAYVERGVA